MGLSLFQTSTLGMMAQAHALNTIGSNIANISTGGYKRIDTCFATMMSSNIRTGAGSDGQISFANEERGMGGVKPKDYQTLDQQGLLTATERSLDLAIAGDGFFQVSPTLTTGSQIFFTRDGGFDVNVAGASVSVTADDGSTINVRQGYLADKNGYFLLGISRQRMERYPPPAPWRRCGWISTPSPTASRRRPPSPSTSTCRRRRPLPTRPRPSA